MAVVHLEISAATLVNALRLDGHAAKILTAGIRDGGNTVAFALDMPQAPYNAVHVTPAYARTARMPDPVRLTHLHYRTNSGEAVSHNLGIEQQAAEAQALGDEDDGEPARDEDSEPDARDED